MEPEIVEQRGNCDYVPLTDKQLGQIAIEHGVSELYEKLVNGLKGVFEDHYWNTKSTIAFIGTSEKDETQIVILSVIPGRSKLPDGVKFTVYFERFLNFFGLDRESALEILPLNRRKWKSYGGLEYSGYEGFFKTPIEIDNFLDKLLEAKKLKTKPV
jgi:hypothetical protein